MNNLNINNLEISNPVYCWLGILILFVTTYFTRMLPLVLCKKQIENKFIKSTLAYLPYAVLTSMIFPEIFEQKIGLIASIMGFIVAVILAYFNKSLIVVLVFATLVGYVFMLIDPYIMSILPFKI